MVVFSDEHAENKASWLICLFSTTFLFRFTLTAALALLEAAAVELLSAK